MNYKLIKLRLRVLGDIKDNYHVSQRYLTVREICSRFAVSLQTAQKCVTQLKDEGVLSTCQRSGIFVKSIPNQYFIDDSTILMISSNSDPRFNEAFVKGIRVVSDLYHLNMECIVKPSGDTSQYEFGEWLITEYRKHNARGAVCLAFKNANLAFYHAISNGCLLISDVIPHDFPILPSIQSDNRKHSMEAARKMVEWGKRNIMIVGYWPYGNIRHNTFEKEFLAAVPDGKIKYVCLQEELSTADIYIFMSKFTPEKGVFSSDYAANYTIASYFLTNNIPVWRNILVFDSEDNLFLHPKLAPIEAAAPALKTLGKALGEKLIMRLRTGTWSEPLQSLI